PGLSLAWTNATEDDEEEIDLGVAFSVGGSASRETALPLSGEVITLTRSGAVIAPSIVIGGVALRPPAPSTGFSGIYHGEDQINAIKHGTNDVVAVYHGETKIFEAG